MIEKLVWSPEQFPFSFLYDGKPSSELLPEWEQSETVEETASGRIRHLSFTDPVTQLCVTAHVRQFNDFEALDWMLEFQNNGTINTPIIENILPLDAALPVSCNKKVQLHYSKGSDCEIDDFMPITEEIRSWQRLSPVKTKSRISLSPNFGRSSDGVLPFMNLQTQDGGLVLAIGWTGQWAASFERKENDLHVSAGLERTHLRLLRGEKIRTPRILFLDWKGKDNFKGNNLLRQLILAHYTPRVNGELVTPPISYLSMLNFGLTGKVSEEIELNAISHAAKLGVEAHWIDACWYGPGKKPKREDEEDYVEIPQVGNWFVRPDAFPRGLEPIGWAAHKSNMKFILWFEPERAPTGCKIQQEHQEFLIGVDNNPETHYLFNLGMPKARAYLIDLLSKIISDSGVDVYRQDFNMGILEFWQIADAPDRIGASESHYIEGMYALWDELRRRHPGLAIDNCSSGGRRIDLETISRSYPLWRSDYCCAGPENGENFHIGDQSQIVGLSQWVPLHSGAIWTFTPYSCRSAMSGGFTFGLNIPPDLFPDENGEIDMKKYGPDYNIWSEKFNADQVRKAITEVKSLRPYFLGDFYPLLPLTTADHDWCAYQYHREDLGAGFAVFLRRHKSPFPSMKIPLRAVDPKSEYQVSMATSFDEPSPELLSGKDLSNIEINISKTPGSVLLRYSRIR